jgi:hypothetical protein
MGFLIKEKSHKTIQESHEMALKNENNLSSFNIEPFSAPRVKMDDKPKVVHNNEANSNIGAILAKIQLTIDGMVKTK